MPGGGELVDSCARGSPRAPSVVAFSGSIPAAEFGQCTHNKQDTLTIQRLAGFLIDATLCWVVIVTLAAIGMSLVVLNASIYLGYRVLFSRLVRTQTIGRAVVGVRVQGANGDRISLLQALLRELPVAACLVGPLVGGLAGFVILFVGLPSLLVADAAVMGANRGAVGLRDLAARTRGRKAQSPVTA
jgi:uncharacterized RDD family membrane protein YckC